jgi:hypothetical protein
VWRWISNELESLDLLNLTPLGEADLEVATKRRAEKTYSILLKHRINWAPNPSEYPRDFTWDRYRDELQDMGVTTGLILSILPECSI